jgi:hypothetical protein
MTTDTDYRQSTYALARLAESGDPDTPDGLGYGGDDPDVEGSPGAEFLRSVENGARELWEAREGDPERWLEHVNDDGSVHEIADGAPSVYTHQRWAEFHDLAAYNDDMGEISALTGSYSDMTNAAGVALYMIAERLAWALLREWAEEATDDETEDE